ncbi:DUF3108 domain-containing protein [Agaribacter flavus]|uniref:DUF3108 domain-containing protein n=1 Tax=Agaribacter flavus TaxID=1902781 RepID=A0ABV7FNA4_9ALTE
MSISSKQLYRGLASLICLMGIISSADAQNYVLKPFSSEFTAYHDNDEVGSASLQLERLPDNTFKLNYHSKVSKFFLSDKRYETSVFSITPQGFVPITYEYVRKGTGRNKHLFVEFKNDERQIKVNEEVKYRWHNELDNQLFRIDLSNKLANDSTLITYDFINSRGEKRRYTIEKLKKETLSLPYGELEAFKVKINRETNKRKTFAWYAPSLNWALVRLQQFKEDKEQGDMRLSSFEQ